MVAPDECTSFRLTSWFSSPLTRSPERPVWDGWPKNTVGKLRSEMRACTRGGSIAGGMHPREACAPSVSAVLAGARRLGPSFSPGTRHLQFSACGICLVQVRDGVLSCVRLDLMGLERIVLAAQVDGVLASAVASSSGDGSGGKPASSEGIGIAASGGTSAAGRGSTSSSTSARDRGGSTGGTAQAVGECLLHAALRTFLRHRGAGSITPRDRSRTSMCLPRTPGNTPSHPHSV